MKHETISPDGTVPQGSPGYASYLLRLLWVEQDGRKTFQALLAGFTTKEQRTFADLESLMAYLQSQTPGLGGANPDAQTGKEETM
jgi:hypothetical protein